VSIVRIGLAETKKFAEGWDAIFSKRRASSPAKAKAKKKGSSGRKKSGKKK